MHYERLVEKLSDSSVGKQFDAYRDIDWDAPEHRVEVEDPRWELPGEDALGGTDWYRSLPQARRAQLGLQVVVCQLKVGIEFERVLQRGLLELVAALPDGAPEARYATHELIEEAQHCLMFSELIRRTGLDAPGMAGRVRWGSRRVPRLGRTFPELFFAHVLAGEVPIDQIQRSELRSGRVLHPLLRRIVQAHVTEEARHVRFARAYLERHVPRLGAWRLLQLRLMTPLLLGDTARTMMVPPRRALTAYRVPAEVARLVYGSSPAWRSRLAWGVAPMRELCIELGIASGVFRRLWERQGLWGSALD